MTKPFAMGAVAYAPKVVTIWEGFKEYFRRHHFEFDFVLYSNYEKQVEAQFTGEIDMAWNSPLAWVRADRIAKSKGQNVQVIAMRDTDRDLTSVLVVRKDSQMGMSTDSLRSADVILKNLIGKTIGFGAVDSPQATLIPLIHLRDQGLVAGKDFIAQRFDVLGGKHGDHIGGERDAAIALMRGEIDAAWMIDGNHLSFTHEGILPSSSTRIISQTGRYDHCNFTLSPGADQKKAQIFAELLFSMKWENPEVRPLLELEGLKSWLPGRTSGYELLIRATDIEKFYDPKGNILVADYQY